MNWFKRRIGDLRATVSTGEKGLGGVAIKECMHEPAGTHECREPAETDENGKGRMPSASPGRLRVLFIDDEESIRTVIARLLEIDNHDVDLAADGKEGVRKFRANQYDLVITDWAMPGMYGDKVAAKIKAINHEIPIIMLTGFAATVTHGGKPPVGVDMVISKPMTQDAFRSAIEQVMANGSARIRNVVQ